MITENCAYLRSVIPDVQFTADIICGFPGESDEDFAVTMENVRSLGLLFAHIFPYSDRPGTEASEMKDKVDEAVKNARCAALRETVNESRKMIISDYIDKDKKFYVLIETEKDGFAYGHTENFIEVRVKADVFAAPLLYEALNEGDGNVSGGCVFAPSLLGRVFSVKLTNMSENGKDLVVNADKI
jgi:threonylcarbamoyladenosine tRNA methylthiotransferase MtaB